MSQVENGRTAWVYGVNVRWEEPIFIYLSLPNTDTSIQNTLEHGLLSCVTSGGVIKCDDKFYLLAANPLGCTGWSRCLSNKNSSAACPRLRRDTWNIISFKTHVGLLGQLPSNVHYDKLENFTRIGHIVHESPVFGYLLIQLRDETSSGSKQKLESVSREVQEAHKWRESRDPFRIQGSTSARLHDMLTIKSITMKDMGSNPNVQLDEDEDSRHLCVTEGGRHYRLGCHILHPRSSLGSNDSGCWVYNKPDNKLIGYVLGAENLKITHHQREDLVVMPLAGPAAWDIGLQLQWINRKIKRNVYDRQMLRLLRLRSFR